MTKICDKCGEINGGSNMFCLECSSSLTNAKQKEEYIPTQKSTRTSYSGNPEAVSIGSWILIFIILSIPIVNIIALFIMAFGYDNENINNYAKATLIIIGIAIGIGILIRLLFA